MPWFWSSKSPETCPVDHAAAGACPVEHPAAADASACPVPEHTRLTWLQKMGRPPHAMSHLEDVEEAGATPFPNTHNLDTEREVLTIPRTGEGRNWVYPSQKQFFDAMKRKKWNPEALDMAAVVPIHNAVNEQAWRQIMFWERGMGGEQCGGVELTSFQGDAAKRTPRAWVRTLMGNEPPFDRHDWTVDRCGVEVKYVIDFYGGDTPGDVFLDVRPSVVQWEGLKTRLWKVWQG